MIQEEGLRAVLHSDGPAAAMALPAYGSGDGRVLVDLDDRDALSEALDAG